MARTHVVYLKKVDLLTSGSEVVLVYDHLQSSSLDKVLHKNTSSAIILKRLAGIIEKRKALYVLVLGAPVKVNSLLVFTFGHQESRTDSLALLCKGLTSYVGDDDTEQLFHLRMPNRRTENLEGGGVGHCEYVDYVARSRSLSSWSEGERALGVVIPTRFPCISYSHRSILSSTRVSYSLLFLILPFHMYFQLHNWNQKFHCLEEPSILKPANPVNKGAWKSNWNETFLSVDVLFHSISLPIRCYDVPYSNSGDSRSKSLLNIQDGVLAELARRKCWIFLPGKSLVTKFSYHKRKCNPYISDI
ncbi:unnamed protein product [Sphenostylis stenocarpa]|uniref:Uncharacterized protein n=1 Tax=Sphenostylis stenocarpa TaxID=92480 RepID=A0AA86T7Y7_9FABA|nr:unnamed protein product [Sphenostylis stenocarpa]